MCGINGYLGIKNDKIKLAFNSSLKKLEHRGPDFSGMYQARFFNKILLVGHTRLSIIDLNSRSDQPFFYRDKILVFNGEIYNYKSIRNELKYIGCKFKTSGDTEVLIQALHHWGIEKTLSKIDGMWAFCYADLKKKKIFLSRDKFGEKPLYYIFENNNFYFSSEVSSLKELYPNKINVNLDHIKNYIVYGYRVLHKEKNNFYIKIKELEKSSFLEVNSTGEINLKKYWNPSFKNLIIKKKDILTYDDYVKKIRKILIESVKLRMQSDVPIAFCMSSGIDSNSLASIAKKILKKDIAGFTILSEDKKYDESYLTNQSAKHLDIDLFKIKIKKKNFLGNLKNIVEFRNSPIYTISYYIHWQMANEIRNKKFKVSISGVGADEIFTGYYEHYNALMCTVQNKKESKKYFLNKWKQYYLKFIRNKNLRKEDLFIKNKNYSDYRNENTKGISKLLCQKNYMKNFKSQNLSNNFLRNRMLNELFYETVPPILHEDDLNSMHNSIENRSPFLNSELVNEVNNIPTEFLFNKGIMKSLLRDSMRGVVLDKIIDNKKKMGFNNSLFDYFSLNEKKNRDFLLKDSPIFEIIDHKKFSKFIDNISNTNEDSKFLFNFINTKFFLEKFY